MGSVDVRNKKQVVSFRFNNVCCREQAQLPDTPASRKRMKKPLKIIEVEILMDSYA